jgi:hypothetical protein
MTGYSLGASGSDPVASLGISRAAPTPQMARNMLTM